MPCAHASMPRYPGPAVAGRRAGASSSTTSAKARLKGSSSDRRRSRGRERSRRWARTGRCPRSGPRWRCRSAEAASGVGAQLPRHRVGRHLGDPSPLTAQASRRSPLRALEQAMLGRPTDPWIWKVRGEDGAVRPSGPCRRASNAAYPLEDSASTPTRHLEILDQEGTTLFERLDDRLRAPLLSADGGTPRLRLLGCSLETLRAFYCCSGRADRTPNLVQRQRNSAGLVTNKRQLQIAGGRSAPGNVHRRRGFRGGAW